MSDNSKLIKSIFLIFYSISSLTPNFFIIPILCQYLIRIGLNPKWTYLGFIFSIYEFGKFFGNFFWIFLNQIFTSSLLIIISLFLLLIINFSYFSIKTYFGFLIYRFLLGFVNNLSLMSENLYHELSLKKDFGIILYIIKTFSTLISILLSIDFFKINNNNRKYWDNYSSIIVSFINIITIIIIIIMIKLKHLKFKLSKKIIKMNVYYNDYDNSIKTGKKFSIEISNQNKKIKSNENTTIKKKNSGITINTNTDEILPSIERSVQTKINNNDENLNRFDSNNNSKVIDTGGNFTQLHKNEQNDIIKNENLSFNNKEINIHASINSIENIQISKNNNDNNNQVYKELKYCFIFILLNINDSILLIWVIMIMYIQFNLKEIKIGISFCLYNLLFSLINYPFTKKLMNKFSQSTRNIISNKMIFHLIILIIFTLFNGILIYFYILPKGNFEIIFLLTILLFTLFRNLINSLIIQMFQIYISIEYNVQSENMRKIQKLKTYLNPCFRTIIVYISSFAFFFLSKKTNKQNNISQYSLYIITYFVLIPEILICTTIILIKLYM